jgi:hypothetical protein
MYHNFEIRSGTTWLLQCGGRYFSPEFNGGHDGGNQNLLAAFSVQQQSRVRFPFSHFFRIFPNNRWKMDVSLVHRGWSAQMDLLVRSAVQCWIELTIMPILLTPGLSKQKHSSNSKSGWTNHRFVQMYHNFEIRSGTTWLLQCGGRYFSPEFNGGHDGGNQNLL